MRSPALNSRVVTFFCLNWRKHTGQNREEKHVIKRWQAFGNNGVESLVGCVYYEWPAQASKRVSAGHGGHGWWCHCIEYSRRTWRWQFGRPWPIDVQGSPPADVSTVRVQAFNINIVSNPFLITDRLATSDANSPRLLRQFMKHVEWDTFLGTSGDTNMDSLQR